MNFSDIIVSGDRPVSPDELDNLNKLLYRRIKGEPLQYILGLWEFYSLPFYVGEGVLIPRADTETLVDAALSSIEGINSPKVIELGAGCGAIAIAIAKKRPDAHVLALELSDIAIDYLKRNLELNKINNVSIIKADIYEYETTEKYDLLVCNPPYIKTDDIVSLQKEMNFEPKIALDGGNDGLMFYKEIASRWQGNIKNNGKIAVEIGSTQKADIIDIFSCEEIYDITCIK